MCILWNPIRSENFFRVDRIRAVALEMAIQSLGPVTKSVKIMKPIFQYPAAPLSLHAEYDPLKDLHI